MVLLQQGRGWAATQGRYARELLARGRWSALARSRHHCHFQLALRIAALLDSTQVIRSFHDLTNDAAPSFCSCAANASTAMPALVKLATTFSQSPPSAASSSPTLPWSATALSVFSGMVLIVKGAARAFT